MVVIVSEASGPYYVHELELGEKFYHLRDIHYIYSQLPPSFKAADLRYKTYYLASEANEQTSSPQDIIDMRYSVREDGTVAMTPQSALVPLQSRHFQ
jgi:hypothetical protein